MRRYILASAVLASAVSVVLSTHAKADNENFHATLSGFEEVGGLPRVTSAPGWNLKPFHSRRERSSPPAGAPSN